MSRDCVIVSTARTPIGRAYRGAFNATGTPTLAAHAITHALARYSALRAGLPERVPGVTIDRQCASGLDAIATAAARIPAWAK